MLSYREISVVVVCASALSAGAATSKDSNPAVLPLGKYACVVLTPLSFFDTGVLQVLPDQQYAAIEGGGGAYTYDPAIRSVQFKSGTYAKGEIEGQFFPNGVPKGGLPRKKDAAIVLKPAKSKKVNGVEIIPTQYCYLLAEPKTGTPKKSTSNK